MDAGSGKAYTCRLPAAETELLERARGTTGIDRAKLLRRAFRYYVSSNPDGLHVFEDQSINADREAIRDSDLFDELERAIDTIGVDELLRLAAEEIDDFDRWLQQSPDGNRYRDPTNSKTEMDRLLGL
jgi:hypothetical protein